MKRAELSTFKVLGRCASYLLRHWAGVALLFVLMLAVAAFMGLPVILVDRFINAIGEIGDGGGDAAYRSAQLVALAMGGAVAMSGVLGYCLSILKRYLANLVAAEVREEGMARYLRMSMAFFDRDESGDAVVKLSGDSNSVWRLAILMVEMVELPLKVIGLAGAVVWVNWKLGVLGLVGVPFGVLPIYYLSKRIKKYSKKGRKRTAEIAKIVVQVFAGMRVVLAYGQEDAEAHRFGNRSRSLLSARIKSGYARAGSRAAVHLLMGLGFLAVMIAGLHMIRAGAMDMTGIVEDVSAVLIALGLLRSPLKNIVKNNSNIHALVPSAQRILQVLDMAPDMVDAPDAVEIDGLKEAIVFEDLSFSYDREPVLEGVSITVPVGSTCAVVGPSGVGKSSLLNLVPRFYDPSSGRVTIDGVDVSKIRMASLRTQIAIVTQDTFLFDTTIAENIRYGRPAASDDEVIAAARAANVHDEIAAFPKGYETNVGSRGLSLSGGQRQRVAIARAILRDAPILILDEATSSLDSIAEREVQAALDRLSGGRTTLVVAHRLSTISDADMIVVLNEGTVEATGRHEELLASSPTYAKLWQAQQHMGDSDEEQGRAHSSPVELLAEDLERGGPVWGGDGENDEDADEDDVIDL